ncbi:MAG: hypothetical protein MUC48_10795 [Leptolyngbya sp. Prado105]|jgi:hypothetical protein|nr:hypothetical protein [Leptolyngbya sp. Prado105]
MVFSHALNALTAFMAANFPGWGCCHFSFDADQRILYIYPKTSHHRIAVLQDRDRLSQLDIGVEQFVVVHFEHPNTTISTVSNSI